MSVVPFASNEWHYAFHYNGYVGADELMTAKLNSNYSAFTEDYIVEYLGPPFETSWTTNFDPVWWHNAYNQILYSNSLNTYLNNYYNVLVEWQIPYGANGNYVHNVYVFHFDGYDPNICNPPPCPDSPPGSGIHCWHYMVGYRIHITPTGLGE